MKIAVFGLARSGLSVYRYLTSSKYNSRVSEEVEIYLINKGDPDSWPCYQEVKTAKCFNDSDTLDFIKDLDFIVLSPGIPRTHSALAMAHKKEIPIISEVEFTVKHTDIPIVGITGTNGKTTTTTMIGEFLNSVGVCSFICGNIGIPFADILLSDKNYDYAIVELSSFQLESIDQFHPQISLLLNLSENHMERYEDIESYKEAKHQIFKNQKEGDLAIVYETVECEASQVIIRPLNEFDYSRSKLIGSHNKTNFFCTYKVAEKVLQRDFKLEFQKFIDEFKGVDYRLSYVDTIDGLDFYNDAKSTNIAATVAALNSFANPETVILILGGKLREETVEIRDIYDFQKLKTIFVYGEAASKIEENLRLRNIKKFSTLEEIMQEISLFSNDKNVERNVLFSPAFPSFDQYQNYEFRGAHFSELVKKIARNYKT